MNGTRNTLFESVDRPALKPLPEKRYEFRHFEKATIRLDYHVEFDKHFYSVPHQLRNEHADIWATSTTVEIFSKGVRIATHPRSYLENKATTLDEHRPKSHREFGDWTTEKLAESASKIGPAASALVEAIIQRQKHPEQGLRSCLGILRLTKRFDEQRLESACKRALLIQSYSYKSVKSILSSNLDQLPIAEKQTQLSIVHENIRGAEAFAPKVIEEQHHVSRIDDREIEASEVARNGESFGIANGTKGGP
ncbi:MAG: hypothetical protein K2X77_09085 [Candidatus Obscuribacterales bacterium]|jgi:transposase|nr:hypothetical protein [Candidatus Obscuribacterales bacterium]